MPKQSSHAPVVREWCQSLAILTAVAMTRDEAQMRLAAYVPLLMREFPDAAFTADSVSHVARRSPRGWPTYGELCAALSEWWSDRKPLPLALPAPPDERPLLQRDPPTPETIAHVRRVAAEAIAALRADTAPAVRVEPTPRYLTPAQLDQHNPLPNGRKRTDAAA